MLKALLTRRHRKSHLRLLAPPQPMQRNWKRSLARTSRGAILLQGSFSRTLWCRASRHLLTQQRFQRPSTPCARAERVKKAQSLTTRVSQCLSGVTEGRIDAHETSARLGLSHRSFERGLTSEGTTFSELLDHSLKARLETLLSGRRTSGEELAFNLGYGDSTSFYRAVRRLYGEPLSSLRKRLNG